MALVNSFFNSYSIATVRNSVDNLRPFLAVDIYGQSVSGLLDSGSSISILGSHSHVTFLELGATLAPCEGVCKIQSVNGVASNIVGYLHLPVVFQDTVKIIKFHVIPDVKTPFIFGWDLWRAFHLAPRFLNTLPRTSAESLVVAEINKLQAMETLTSEQRQVADKVISMFENISFEKVGLGKTDLITHTIDTGDTKPIKQRYYPMSPEKLKELHYELDKMLELGVVEPSSSAWNNPTLLTSKASGELRFCLDSRKLNAVSKHDAYPLPYISQILDRLRDAKYLSSIDLSSAFWQIELDPTSREKTAFTIPGRGLYQFSRMCFGLTGAPATQQRLMDSLFGPDGFNNHVFAYLDDIVICHDTFEGHVALLREVFARLQNAGLTIKYSKCQFFRRELKYLGYIVNEKGLHTDPAKVRSILDFPTPSSRKEVKMFLGTASYYRRFIKKFSLMAAPLNKLTSSGKKAPPFKWTPEAEESFQMLKQALVSAPILACPDFTKPFSLHCDASAYGIAGMLAQEIDGKEHPIAFASKSLSKCETNYSATEREALAVVFAVEHFRPYLEGSKPFKIVTDHASLRWFLNLSNPTGRLARWGCRLSPYNFEIEHRAGKDNVVPDALSRFVPCIAAIAKADSFTPTGDAWFDHLYTKCLNNPLSCRNLMIRDGRLFRHTKSGHGLAEDFQWKEIVAKSGRESIIEKYHCLPTSAHLGIQKTFKKIALTYYWPGLFKDVADYVRNCETCLSHKIPAQTTPGLMGSPKQCCRPFQTLSMDLVGPFPVSRNRYTHLFVVMCCFTKYVMLFPLRRATAASIIKHLEHDVFMKHGIPQTVISDNGTQFTGNEIQALFHKYSIPQIHLGPRYCPQVNPVERQNRTIVTAISSLIKDDHRMWDEHLPHIEFAINTSISEATGFSPFLLVHGREAIVTGSVYDCTPLDVTDLSFPRREDYAGRLFALSGIFRKVREELDKAHVKNTHYYNLRRRHTELNIGQTVWKRTFPLSDKGKFFSAKLAPKYVKCTVVEKKSPLVYKLLDEYGKDAGIWHIKDIKISN